MDGAGPAIEAFVEEILPTCQEAGRVALCYAQGSLVSGYTSQADLDVVVVWDHDVPTRRSWLAALHEPDDPATAFFTYDAPDLAIDRLWRAGQEFNLAHHSRAAFLEHTSADAPGPALANDRTTQQIRSGFQRGRVLLDTGMADACRDAIVELPAGYTAEALRRARNDWAYARTELAKAASRHDELVFATVLSASAVVQVVAVFAAAGHYYPGLKWLRRVMDDLGVDAQAKARYDDVWHRAGDHVAQVAAMDALAARVAALMPRPELPSP